MLFVRRVRREFGGLVCRACLNDLSRVHLRRRNCVYQELPGTCARCHIPEKHLVRRLKISGIVKILLKMH